MRGRIVTLAVVLAPAGTLAAVHLAADGVPSGDLDIQTWGRLHPAVQDARLDPADPQAPLFARLDAGTLYLSLPSFPLYTRTRHLPEGALDVVGITPDVPVPDDLADPLTFAVRLLAAGETPAAGKQP